MPLSYQWPKRAFLTALVALAPLWSITDHRARAADLPYFIGDGHNTSYPQQSATFSKSTAFPSPLDQDPAAATSLQNALRQQALLLSKPSFNKTYSLDGLPRPVSGTDLAQMVSRLQQWQGSGAPLSSIADAWLLKGDGQSNVRFTSYFTPSLAISEQRSERFRYPLYRKPSTMADPLPSHQQINDGALNGQGLELAWTDSLTDLFFMQVQGSGYGINASTGQRRLFSFGGKNGHPYASVGKYLVEKGEISADTISMAAIKTWISNHPQQARSVLEINPSYVFFTEDKTEVAGAAAVPLTAIRSVAADSTVLPLGAMILIEMPILDANGRVASYSPRLMAVQDRGGAIKGSGRIDIYAGSGPEAEALAGNLKHFGRVWLLLPR